MKKVVDSRGSVIDGLYRYPDGSLGINNIIALNKNNIQHKNFANLTHEVNLLKEQMKQILEKLNAS